jgi:hypothetical protein
VILVRWYEGLKASSLGVGIVCIPYGSYSTVNVLAFGVFFGLLGCLGGGSVSSYGVGYGKVIAPKLPVTSVWK